jgi:hypothetical protein
MEAHAPRGLFRFLEFRRRLPAAMSATSSRTALSLPPSSSAASAEHSGLAAGGDKPLNRLNTAAFRALASPASRPPPFFAEEPTEENALAFSCQIPGQNHLLFGASSPSRTEKGDATQGRK